MTQPAADRWDAGQSYDEFMGRWSRPAALEFLRWLSPSPGWHWLDVGTGTGALAEAIARTADPASVVGCDPSPSFIEAARRGVRDRRITFVVAGTGNLPPGDGGYDAVVSGLALNFFPDVGSAVEEQARALRPGGVIGAFVWDYAGGMEFLRHFWDACVTVSPQAELMDEGRRFPICDPGALRSLFLEAGVANVRIEAIGVPTEFASFDDYWRPFLGATGPAPSFVAGLSEDQRQRLSGALRERLPTDPSGRIRLRAGAWAVAGTAP